MTVSVTGERFDGTVAAKHLKGVALSGDEADLFAVTAGDGDDAVQDPVDEGAGAVGGIT
ncbi:hypothetical protein [Streptomyces radiopugnans]|uniref:hypothetical protein n=1 Tax=Streptomyces radiopugnans TaxID=403935 RepID=UPI003F1CE864